MEKFEELKAILLNRSKGASLLTDDAIDLILKLLRNNARDKEVEEALISIYFSHPVVSSLFHLIAIYVFYQRSGRDTLIRVYEQWKARLLEDRARVVRRAVERLENYKCFATLSHSSFIMQVFSQLAARGYTARVFVGESRPGGEGVLTANFLSRLGFEVILTPDSCLPSVVEDAQILLLGVDTLSKTFYIHKSGTRPTVIGARLHGVPVCLLLTQDKWLPSSWESLFAHHLQKLKQREQVAGESWIELKMRFDLSPATFVDLIITPEGEFTHAQILTLYEKDSPLPWTHMDFDPLLEFLVSGGESAPHPQSQSSSDHQA